MMTESEFINKYIAVPYKHMGRSMAGLDCGGLVVLCYKDLGHEIFFLHDYNKSEDWGNESLFLKHYHKEWEDVKKPSLYDVVIFNRWENPGSHAGIVLSNNRFAHIHKMGFTVNRLNHPIVKKITQGFYHLKARI